MIGLNDPTMWNILVSIAGGIGIASASRLMVPYSNEYRYKSFLNVKKKVTRNKVKGIADNIGEAVRSLDIFETEQELVYEGETLDVESRIKANIEEEAGIKNENPVFQREFYETNPKLDYIVCFSNTDARTKCTEEPKIVAAAIVKILNEKKIKPSIYAIGSDLVEIENEDALLSVPKQSGYNLFHCLKKIYSLEFDNPTYAFFVLNSNATVTDEKKQKEVIGIALIHTNILNVFMEMGKAHHPYTVSGLSTILNGQYGSISGSRQNIAMQVSEMLQESTVRMRGLGL